MTDHPALTPGRTAVVTGAASGIGLAAATRFAELGLKLVLADLGGEALTKAAAIVAKAAPGGAANVLAVPTDVSRREEVERLKDEAYAAFGDIAVLMNNAAIDGAGGILAGDATRWQKVLLVNLFGPIHGCQVFGPAIVAQGKPAAIINTGSKQGITTPPGDTAYNISKAGVKVLTEALAHDLRSIEGCRVTAHLLIPGFTFTGLTKAAEKPPAAWTAGQVVDFMLESIGRGDFYVLCPDNTVTRGMDEKRMEWAAQDVIRNRPALSRWHKDYAPAFEAFMKEAGL